MSNYAIEMIKAATGLLAFIGVCGLLLYTPELIGMVK